MSQFLLCDSIESTVLKDCCSQWLLGLVKKEETQKSVVAQAAGSRKWHRLAVAMATSIPVPLGRPAVDSNFREHVDHLHLNYLGS